MSGYNYWMINDGKVFVFPVEAVIRLWADTPGLMLCNHALSASSR